MPTVTGPPLQHWGGGSNAPPPQGAPSVAGAPPGYQVCAEASEPPRDTFERENVQFPRLE